MKTKTLPLPQMFDNAARAIVEDNITGSFLRLVVGALITSSGTAYKYVTDDITTRSQAEICAIFRKAARKARKPLGREKYLRRYYGKRARSRKWWRR